MKNATQPKKRKLSLKVKVLKNKVATCGPGGPGEGDYDPGDCIPMAAASVANF